MRRFRAAAVVVAVGALVLPGTAALAASPDPQTVTVPTTVGATRTVTWTGTIPAGSAHPTSECDSVPAGVDAETLTINAPANYNTLSASFTFSISWTPVDRTRRPTTSPPPSMNTAPPAAAGRAAPSAPATPAAPPRRSSPATSRAAHYEVQACGFLNTTPQPYTGKLVITTNDGRAAAPACRPPRQRPRLLRERRADPQRDEAEPLIETGRTAGSTPAGPPASATPRTTPRSPPTTATSSTCSAPRRAGSRASAAAVTAPSHRARKNSQGNYQYAYAGLGPLTGFATSTSPDNGHTPSTPARRATAITDTGR